MYHAYCEGATWLAVKIPLTRGKNAQRLTVGLELAIRAVLGGSHHLLNEEQASCGDVICDHCAALPVECSVKMFLRR